MTPSKDFNLHSLAKKAKHRLIGKLDNSQVAYVSKSANQRCEYYCKVVRMLTSTEKVYDPIARLIGKDLSTIHDSSEKQRLVFNTCKEFNYVRDKLKSDASKAHREHRQLIVNGIAINPREILDKLRGF